MVALFCPAIVLRFCIIFDEKEITVVIYCLDVLYCWFRNFRCDHIWRLRTDWSNLDKAKFFDPNILKTTLCLALVIMSLLSSTGRDCTFHGDLIEQLSLRMVFDFFDGVEMLDVIIEENEFSHNVPKGFERKMRAFVCISFLVSPLQLVEIKIGGSDTSIFIAKNTIVIGRGLFEIFPICECCGCDDY